MNIYACLNEAIEYIEENLENKIDYQEIAKIFCTNEYTMKRIFSLITNISLAEYIRNRRLSNAGYDLYKGNEKIIDIALKYQYESSTAFSRAFEKFHGLKPSSVKNAPEKLKVYPKFYFNEVVNENSNMEYSIAELDEMVLYGKGIKTNNYSISKDAPNFFAEMRKIYYDDYGLFDYGMIVYEDRFDSEKYEYWVCYNKPVQDFEKVIIPKSKWLIFKINSQEAEDIQKVSKEFYEKFIPSSKYKLKPIPELEYYHDDITEFLIPLED